MYKYKQTTAEIKQLSQTEIATMLLVAMTMLEFKQTKGRRKNFRVYFVHFLGIKKLISV